MKKCARGISISQENIVRTINKVTWKGEQKKADARQTKFCAITTSSNLDYILGNGNAQIQTHAAKATLPAITKRWNTSWYPHTVGNGSGFLRA
jgi:hypothetical protein